MAFQTIDEWLKGIGMECYLNNFLGNGFNTPRQILNFTFEDLLNLGIEPFIHRKKIYNVIQNAKAQVGFAALISLFFYILTVL